MMMNLERHIGEQLSAKEAILHMFGGGRVISKYGDELALLTWDEERGFLDVTAGMAGSVPVLMKGAGEVWEFEPERDASDIVCCRGPISYDDALKLSRMNEVDFKDSLLHAYASGDVRSIDGMLHWSEGN